MRHDHEVVRGVQGVRLFRQERHNRAMNKGSSTAQQNRPGSKLGAAIRSFCAMSHQYYTTSSADLGNLLFDW